MSQIYNTLEPVFDAYADAIKQNKADITSLNGSLGNVTDKIQHVTPSDWHNTATDTVGYKLKADGTTVENTNSFYTDYISVVPGDVVRAYHKSTHGKVYYTNFTYYDFAKRVLPKIGQDTTTNSDITVPEGAAYIRISLEKNYQPKIIITINLVPTDWSIQYFEPYQVFTEDFLTAETKRKVDDIPTDIADVTVKGSNLIPVSENGVGAYVRNGNSITFYPSYTTFHYAIVKVKKNTRYFINYNPHWWILADEENNVIDGAQYFTPTAKRYIDTGDASVLYVTIENVFWNIGLIVAEGTTGMQDNVKQNSVLKPLNQLMFDGWYACALPKNSIRFTSGIPEKFYFKNILSLPEKDMVALSVGGFSKQEEDGVVITPPANTAAFNNYLFTVYDDNLSVVEQNVNGQFGNNYADNVNDCSVLLIGDSTIERESGKIGQTLLDAFGERGKTVTLLGSRGNAPNLNEGRSGWSAADYVGNTTRGADSTQNPFYNPTSEKFDFSYYMTNQNYASVDFVVIQLGINDLYNVVLYDAKNRIDTLVNDITTMLSSIKEFNSSQKILLNLPTPCTAKTTGQYAMSTVFQKTIRAKFIYYNALMMVLSTGFGYVRCSNCHLILDPQTEIADLIHPTSTGLSKMGMEVLSQINAWQNA